MGILRLRDYLAEKAKFYVPPSQSTFESSSGLSPTDVRLLEQRWQEYLAQSDLGIPDEELDKLFQPLIEQELLSLGDLQSEVDGERNVLGLKIDNHYSSKAMNIVRDGPVNALRAISKLLLRSNIQVLERSIRPDNGNFVSQVDFIIKGPNGKFLMEIKATAVLDRVEILLDRPSFSIRLASFRSTEEKIISKACLHMGSHHARWLALSSHEKWVFLRFHPRDDGPFISYSAIERQDNSTRPFRALLAMLLDAEGELTAESKVKPPPSFSTVSKEDPRGTSKQRKTLSNLAFEVCRVMQKHGKKSKSSALQICWAQHIAVNDEWIAYSAVKGTDLCSPFRITRRPICLRLHRLLGIGETGVVYEAKLELDGQERIPDPRSFAVKMVLKGEYERKTGRIGRLFNEFQMYRKIEHAKHERNHRIDRAVPSCYGMYGAEDCFVLVMDYGGDALDEKDWDSLTDRDRVELFEAIAALHAIGILHSDISPQNVLRRPDGSLCIIDFSESEFHKCCGTRVRLLSSILWR
ncbi:GSE1_5 [Sanghuangporus weigelae]